MKLLDYVAGEHAAPFAFQCVVISEKIIETHGRKCEVGWIMFQELFCRSRLFLQDLVTEAFLEFCDATVTELLCFGSPQRPDVKMDG